MSERWPALAAAAALLVAPGTLADGDPLGGEDLVQQVVREERQRERRVLGLAGAGVAYPSKVEASLGALVYTMPAAYDCRNLCRFEGLLVRAEPGLSAGRLGIGYGRVYGGAAGQPAFLHHPHLGLSLEASFLRTWRDAPLSPPVRSFAGLQARVTVIGVRFSAGVYRQVSGGPAEDPWLVTGGIGWGF
ncbi:MAG: hypothetical protein D6718_13135 [Acidobacteria bacterium]|nr:MAG: hypothetical protein D6718_13135 [Acidobacteriota bacterium]